MPIPTYIWRQLHINAKYKSSIKEPRVFNFEAKTVTKIRHLTGSTDLSYLDIRKDKYREYHATLK